MQDVIIKKSKIHGKGVFANRDFKKGEVVIKLDLSDIVSEVDIEKMSNEQKKRVAFINGKYRRCHEPENHVNYSCNPNTAPINYCDVAIKDIKAGEEITSTPTFDKLEECNCGSDKCKYNNK